MNHTKKNKLPLYIGIPVILLLIFLRFGLYFLKSDGFSGLSMLLPILLLCFILFALCTCGFFAAWVYQDCKKRGDDPVLWAIVVFIATPFIGLLIYFLRRSEIKATCPACGHRISLKAKYCEECGEEIPEARRKAMPGVRLCISCQEEADKQNRAVSLYNRRGSKDSQLK